MLRATCLALLLCSAVAACAKTEEAPPQTHVYGTNHCGGVPRNWSKQGSEFGELSFISRVAVGPNRLEWNGQSTTRDALGKEVVKQRKMTPHSNIEVVFEVGTDCRLVQSIRADVDTFFQCDGKHQCIEYADAELQKYLPPAPKD